MSPMPVFEPDSPLQNDATGPDWLVLGSPRPAGVATDQSGGFSPELLDRPNDLRGDFACGHRCPDGQTTLAVDRFGMQTICWRHGGDGIRFAARADSLVLSRTIDPQAIFDYLFFHVIPSPRTIWKDVHRLPPGHVLRSDGRRVQIEPYWSPSFHVTRATSFDQRATEFRQLLESAVAEQLDGGKPKATTRWGSRDWQRDTSVPSTTSTM